MKPQKIEFSQFEFQEGLITLSDIFQKYAAYFQDHLTKAEVDKFYKDIYD
jgi:hypothetical protein